MLTHPSPSMVVAGAALLISLGGTGYAATGGGGFVGAPDVNDRVVDSIPVGDERPPVRWRATMFNGAAGPRTPVAYVSCTT
jgi:hypothetical protein